MSSRSNLTPKPCLGLNIWVRFVFMGAVNVITLLIGAQEKPTNFKRLIDFILAQFCMPAIAGL
jgi:hypothetical protein